jgi:hypothetical protein
MNYRKVTVRVLFSSLGIAAFAGIIAMVFPVSGTITGRLLGTAIATAVSAILFLLAVNRAEVASTRQFGVSLGVFTLSMYLFGVIAMWIGLLTTTTGRDLEEKFVLSSLLFGGYGALISLGFLCFAIIRLRLAGLMLSFVWALCLLAWLIVIWSGNSFQEEASYFAFPLQTLFPILVLCSIRRHPLFMGLAIGLALASINTSQIALFVYSGELNKNIYLLVVMLTTGGLATVLGIANIIHYRAKANAIPWAERTVLCFVTATVLLLCFAIYINELRLPLPDTVARLSIGSSILTSTTILALVVGQMLRASVFTLYDGSGLVGFCPRCSSKMDIPRGKSTCLHCGLRMKLLIESPNCRTCGYDVTKTSECSACSECGESILLSSTVQ